MTIKKGFIVHPFETTDGKYNVSYGKNHNKTIKSVKSLKEAKVCLAKKGITKAMYDAPTGLKTIKIKLKGGRI